MEVSLGQCVHTKRKRKRLNVLHMHCLRRILGITWQDKVANNAVLKKAVITSWYTLLKWRM